MRIDDEHESLALELGQSLRVRGLRVATAESCTGGMISAAITAIAGSSEWFERGFVTYSNEAKREMLGVAQALLDAHGAVSQPVAIAMAEGALAHSEADVAVSVTGIAGPGGATPGKPVGMVCFGFARRGSPGSAITQQLAGSRAEVRSRSVEIALRGLIEIASGG
ncbi:MAG TPA: CinA family protein [Casimicrobiaceae bacterium]|nr:CinA family protein [Casimicrobiaceae bacterium]